MMRACRTVAFLIALAPAAMAQTPPDLPPIDLPDAPPAVAPVEAMPELNPAPPPTSFPPLPAPIQATLPAGTEAAPSLPAVPAGALPAIDPAVVLPSGDSQFSFGTSPHSIMFTPGQIQRMKIVLGGYEARRGKGLGELEVVGEAIIPVAEPDSYPVFHLSSMAYRAMGDWGVRIGDQHITPRKNDGPIRVIGITPHQVQFSWKPEYFSLLVQREEMNSFAPVESIRNKLTAMNAAKIDRPGEQVVFTLKPNQSFSVGHMQTFEGRIEAPKLEKLVVPGIVDPTAAAAPGVPIPASATASEVNSMNDLLKSRQMFQSLSPPKKQ